MTSKGKNKGKATPASPQVFEQKSSELHELSNNIRASPTKKRAKKFSKGVDIPALLSALAECNTLCAGDGCSVQELTEAILKMNEACKSTRHMHFREFMDKDVARAAETLGYKHEYRTLKDMSIQPSVTLTTMLNKVSSNVIMDVESAHELLIYPVIVEAVDSIEDIFLRIQPYLEANINVNGSCVKVAGNPDMAAGPLKTATSDERILRDSLRTGVASIRQLFTLGEWKRERDFADGFGQLFAQMAAARAACKSKNPIVVNGVLTEGERWMFSCLDGDTFYTSRIFHRSTELPSILAYLRHSMTGLPLPAESTKVKSPKSTSSSAVTGSSYPKSPVLSPVDVNINPIVFASSTLNTPVAPATPVPVPVTSVPALMSPAFVSAVAHVPVPVPSPAPLLRRSERNRSKQPANVKRKTPSNDKKTKQPALPKTKRIKS